MNITEIFDDNITESIDNVTEIIDNNNTTLSNDNNNHLSFEITPIYLLIFTIPCFLSIICCLSFLLYDFIKVIKNKI